MRSGARARAAGGGREFTGGFVLKAAACLTVEVTWSGGTDRALLDFGKGDCVR